MPLFSQYPFQSHFSCQTIMPGLNSLPYFSISSKTKWMNRTVLSFCCCWWWWFMRNLSFTLGFWHTYLGNSRLLMNADWLDRWYLEQSDLAEGFPACGRGVGTRLSFRKGLDLSFRKGLYQPKTIYVSKTSPLGVFSFAVLSPWNLEFSFLSDYV